MNESPREPSHGDEEETEAVERVVGDICPLCEGPLNTLGDCEDMDCEASPDYVGDDEEEEDEEEDEDYDEDEDEDEDE